MPPFQAISRTAHATRRWKRYSNYAFAAPDALAPLVAQELPRATMHLPIGFTLQGGAYALVAVLGLEPGHSLFVAPDGRWTGGYVPAVYRGYPFQLAQTPEGQQVLAIDEGCGLVNDSEGELFFDPQGKPSKAVQDVLGFLQRIHASRQQTQRMCQALAEHQLFQPWPITVQSAAGERQVEGLYRIDEAALNALSPEAFEAVRQAGALPMVYCQLLSMQHLPLLGQLAQARAQAAPVAPATPNGELNLDFLSQGGTFTFGSMQ